MKMNYAEHPTDLQNRAAKLSKQARVCSSLAALHDSALADGVLSRKIKELIALAIGIAGCRGDCIACHIHDALKAGARRQEILEVIDVAVLMGGRPAMICACDALVALEHFEDEHRASIAVSLPTSSHAGFMGE
jgi:AhpD family alkylhydroperoxidase